jgi:hypothetical protein
VESFLVWWIELACAATQKGRTLTRYAAPLLTQIEGFLGASIHLSADGTQIINYAQWADSAALQTMLADPRIRQHQSALATVEPVRCAVRSVHRRTA